MLMGSAKEVKLVDSFLLALCSLFCGREHATFASFQSRGNTPVLKDLLNKTVKDGAIWRAVSFYNRAGIPSGPVLELC